MQDIAAKTKAFQQSLNLGDRKDNSDTIERTNTRPKSQPVNRIADPQSEVSKDGYVGNSFLNNGPSGQGMSTAESPMNKTKASLNVDTSVTLPAETQGFVNTNNMDYNMEY